MKENKDFIPMKMRLILLDLSTDLLKQYYKEFSTTNNQDFLNTNTKKKDYKEFSIKKYEFDSFIKNVSLYSVEEFLEKEKFSSEFIKIFMEKIGALKVYGELLGETLFECLFGGDVDNIDEYSIMEIDKRLRNQMWGYY